jgi:hypothetical protein
LNQFANEFGLEYVERKQEIQGGRSGTTWEIDGKGVRQGSGGFIIIECRCYTTSRQNQEKVGALAYRIADTGAAGGIIVSPLGLQEGAEKVATAENIISVRLNAECTQHEFVLGFLNKIMIAVLDTLSLTDAVQVELGPRTQPS